MSLLSRFDKATLEFFQIEENVHEARLTPRFHRLPVLFDPLLQHFQADLQAKLAHIDFRSTRGHASRFERFLH